MGIINKKQALYFATGFDNTGMYSGRKEAMQIIRGMKNDITEEDVFSGLKSSLAKIAGCRKYPCTRHATCPNRKDLLLR